LYGKKAQIMTLDWIAPQDHLSYQQIGQTWIATILRMISAVTWLEWDFRFVWFYDRESD
jgi:hypothetical protein